MTCKQVYRGIGFDPEHGIFNSVPPSGSVSHWCRYSTSEEAKLFDWPFTSTVAQRDNAMRNAIDRMHTKQVMYTGDLRNAR